MYKLRIDEISDEIGNVFKVYGFDVICPDNKKAVRSYPDIFFNRIRAENFIALLNASDIDERQIPEIIDDVICKAYTLDFTGR